MKKTYKQPIVEISSFAAQMHICVGSTTVDGGEIISGGYTPGDVSDGL